MRTYPVRSVIIFGVCLLHLLFVALIVFKEPVMPAKKQHKPITVNTVTAIQPQDIEKKATAPVAQLSMSKTLPSKRPQPKLKPPAFPTSPVSKPMAPKVNIVKKEPLKKENRAPVKKKIASSEPIPSPAIPSSLLKELEESIAKIEDKSDKQKLSKKVNVKTALSTPVPLQIDAFSPLKGDDSDSRYISLLTDHLHASLHLPDFGEVKIELTLQQDGTVAKLKVLNAESKQNKQYLESRLSLLTFPHLSGSFAKKQEHTFILTFCNE